MVAAVFVLASVVLFAAGGCSFAANDAADIGRAVLEWALTGSEAPGRDLDGAPKPPGSRRIFYRESGEGKARVYSVAYLCEGRSVDGVRFMKEGMKKRGWRLVSEERDPPVLLFDKKSNASSPIAQVFFRSSGSGRSVIYVVIQGGF